MINKEQIIDILGLQKHEEGGYYKQFYLSDDIINTSRKGGKRNMLSCIYYLLTEDSPISYFHSDGSPIIHFFHLGDPLVYRLIHNNKVGQEIILGPEIDKGHSIQFVAPPGCWKSTELTTKNKKYGFSLISEAVSPGWEEVDCIIASKSSLKEKILNSELYDWIDKYAYNKPPFFSEQK